MKNNNRKDTIIQCAREVFYENGYSNTTLDLIAKKADIQKQLIMYYFKSKSNLALNVFDDYKKEQHRQFMNVGDYGLKNPFYIDWAYTIWFPRYYILDNNARQFYIEVNDNVEHKIDPLLETFNSITFPNNKKVKDNQFYDYLASHYASSWFLYHYIKKEINIDPSEFESRFFNITWSPFFSDKKRLETMYLGARTLLDNFEIKTLPSFEIEVKQKKVNHAE